VIHPHGKGLKGDTGIFQELQETDIAGYLVLENTGVLKKKHHTTHQPTGKVAQSWCGSATPLPDPGVKVSKPADMTTPVKKHCQTPDTPNSTCRNCAK